MYDVDACIKFMFEKSCHVLQEHINVCMKIPDKPAISLLVHRANLHQRYLTQLSDMSQPFVWWGERPRTSLCLIHNQIDGGQGNVLRSALDPHQGFHISLAQHSFRFGPTPLPLN